MFVALWTLSHTRKITKKKVKSSSWFIQWINLFLIELRNHFNIPASIATLAQRQPLRWANVGSPTLGQRGFVNWPNVGPTVAHQRWPNVVPTSAQRWHTNVGPTLAQRFANGCMPTLYQHWPNGGCVTGFLWGEPIGNRSVTGWTNSRVE